jgi:polygalacturonase
MKHFLILTAVFGTLLGGRAEVTHGAEVASEQAILAAITWPVFPDREVLITAHGAVAGGDASVAIAAAIAACHAAGGGRVVVPAGEWITGPVRLLSNVELHLHAGATLRFDPDPARYLPVVLTRFEGMEFMNYSPLIVALDAENIAVTGKGTLDGGASAEAWWPWKGKSGTTPNQKAGRNRLVQQVADGVPVAERVYGDGFYLRPNFLQPQRCTGVLIEGVTITNAPMWVIHPLLCTNVTIRGVTVKTLGPNNDGCNPECCRDVLIEGCTFETGDDCIAIKSGRNDDGRRVGVPCENIVIRDCTMKDGHGGVTMGSEVSGDVRNVFVSNCRLDSPHLDRAFRFKSNAVRGGVIENIHIRDTTIGRVAKAVLGIEFDYDEGADGPHRPVLRNVSIERVTSESSGTAIDIGSFPAATITDIRLTDCSFRGVEAAGRLQHVGTLTLENVGIEPVKKSK